MNTTTDTTAAPAPSPKAATGKAAPTKTTTASTAATKKTVTAKPAVKKTPAAKTKAPAAAPTVKPAAKPAKTSPVAKAAAPVAPAPKADKPRKLKMVRDSLSMPKDEYEVIALLKLRAGKLGHAAKKTEILRAGLKAVAALPNAAFLAALQAVPSIKTGRPAKHKVK